MNGNTSCIYGLEDLILFKCPYCPKQSTDLIQSISNPNGSFLRNRKKQSWNSYGNTNDLSCQSNLKDEEQSWSITLSDVKIYYKTIVIKIVWLGLPKWLNVKESTFKCRRHGFDPWSREILQAVEQISLSATTIEPVL